MAYVCQEMCMRIGAVTHRGYGELVLQRYGKVWGWFGAGDLTLTNLVTLVAEFVSIRVGLAYFHLGAGVAVVLGLCSCVHAQRRALLALGAHRPRHGAVQRSVPARRDPRQARRRRGRRSLDFSPFPGGSFNTLLLLLASTIGATVTPWMIFFQQSASADKGMTPRDIKHGRYDTASAPCSRRSSASGR
jgi:Mn2+/Fe2+ NRAMP family transporter